MKNIIMCNRIHSLSRACVCVTCVDSVSSWQFRRQPDSHEQNVRGTCSSEPGHNTTPPSPSATFTLVYRTIISIIFFLCLNIWDAQWYRPSRNISRRWVRSAISVQTKSKRRKAGTRKISTSTCMIDMVLHHQCTHTNTLTLSPHTHTQQGHDTTSE